MADPVATSVAATGRAAWSLLALGSLAAAIGLALLYSQNQLLLEREKLASDQAKTARLNLTAQSKDQTLRLQRECEARIRAAQQREKKLWIRNPLQFVAKSETSGTLQFRDGSGKLGETANVPYVPLATLKPATGPPADTSSVASKQEEKLRALSARIKGHEDRIRMLKNERDRVTQERDQARAEVESQKGKIEEMRKRAGLSG